MARRPSHSPSDLVIRIRASILFAAALALAGCSDSPTDGRTNPVGHISFRYASATPGFNGNFTTSGAAPAGVFSTNTGSPYAQALRDQGGFTVVGSLPRAGRHEIIYVLTPEQEQRTYTIIPGCLQSSNCAFVGFVAAFPINGTLTDHLCSLGSGSVRITSASRRRITGEFSGSGTCIVQGTAGETAVTFSTGSFDVPVNGDL